MWELVYMHMRVHRLWVPDGILPSPPNTRFLSLSSSSTVVAHYQTSTTPKKNQAGTIRTKYVKILHRLGGKASLRGLPGIPLIQPMGTAHQNIAIPWGVTNAGVIKID